jgi:hypothetical protein
VLVVVASTSVDNYPDCARPLNVDEQVATTDRPGFVFPPSFILAPEF